MIKINIISLINRTQRSPLKKVYENSYGEIWNGPDRIPEMHNIGLGWNSLPNISLEDSLLVLEPCCVSAPEYDIAFAKQFKYIFTWTPKAYLNSGLKIIEINFPSYYLPFDIDLYKNCIQWDKRSNEVVFIYNNKFSPHESQLYSFRLKLADLFYQAYGCKPLKISEKEDDKFKVIWYGYNRLHRNYFGGSVISKYEVLKQSKFVVCMENCYDPVFSYNYLTEKMPDVITSGAVPLYLGCYNIDEFNLHNNSYLDLRKYITKNDLSYNIDINSLIKDMKNFDTGQYENYKNAVLENIKKEKGLFYLTSYQRMYDTIIDTYRGDI